MPPLPYFCPKPFVLRNPFQPGDTKTFEKVVEPADFANFTQAADVPGGGLVHPVYSTFALARDAEWACRLFVLEMKEAGEEGIGSMISMEHHAPAFEGETVTFTATLESVERNRILCRYEAHVGRRLVARGEQEQRIVDKAKLDAHFKKLQAEQHGR